jgi:phosphatidylglycerophosphate synthase
MIATHWQLPDAPLRASAVATVVPGVFAVVAAAEVARAELPLGGLYAVKASATFTIVMLLSFGFLQRHHPFSRFGAANQITTVRAMLVALIIGLSGEPRFPIIAIAAAIASLLAVALDSVDGWLARRQRIASDFGARFDMEIDALLVLALAILVSQFEKAGEWVIVSGLLRYIFVGAGSYWPWLRAPLPPSRRRQAICVLQILALTLAILPAVEPPLSTMFAAVALAGLAVSFLVDVLWLWRARRVGDGL